MEALLAALSILNLSGTFYLSSDQLVGILKHDKCDAKEIFAKDRDAFGMLFARQQEMAAIFLPSSMTCGWCCRGLFTLFV